MFWQRHGREVSTKTTVLILGDARNNYHASQAWVVKEIQKKARHVYWLNPEPRSYWDTGDSIVGEYGAHCRRHLRVPQPAPAREVRREPRLTARAGGPSVSAEPADEGGQPR